MKIKKYIKEFKTLLIFPEGFFFAHICHRTIGDVENKNL
jgi:hypothetical protein